jgi:hypothetical protein
VFPPRDREPQWLQAGARLLCTRNGSSRGGHRLPIKLCRFHAPYTSNDTNNTLTAIQTFQNNRTELSSTNLPLLPQWRISKKVKASATRTVSSLPRHMAARILIVAAQGRTFHGVIASVLANGQYSVGSPTIGIHLTARGVHTYRGWKTRLSLLLRLRRLFFRPIV